jgi:hypothetical protein
VSRSHPVRALSKVGWSVRPLGFRSLSDAASGAGGKKVNLPSVEHTLVLRSEDVNHGLQHDLDKLGIAKTAREEKKRQRDAKLRKPRTRA